MSLFVAERCARFRALHQSGIFVIPNPWDAGTAVYLKHLGFQALATTSSGFSFSIGRPDMEWAVPRDMAIAHIAAIVEATDLPVNADFESGYAHDPEGVAANVALCADTGVAGLSIEDNSGDAAQPLYAFDLAVARIRAARAALDSRGSGVLLCARSEAILLGVENALTVALRRIEAFVEAGADVLYVPGLKTAGEVSEVVRAAAGKPVNVLVGGPNFTVRQLEDLGVRRISVGSGLARAAWGGFIRAAKEIGEDGTFKAFTQNEPFAALNALFGAHQG